MSGCTGFDQLSFCVNQSYLYYVNGYCGSDPVPATVTATSSNPLAVTITPQSSTTAGPFTFQCVGVGSATITFVVQVWCGTISCDQLVVSVDGCTDTETTSNSIPDQQNDYILSEALTLLQNFTDISPYLITMTNGTLWFNNSAASANGLSTAEVIFGTRITSVYNNVIQKVLSGTSLLDPSLLDPSTVDGSLMQELAPLFKYLMDTQDISANASGNYFFDCFVPCVPRLCKPNVYFKTRDEVEQFLLASGYHHTAWYAITGVVDPDDFSKSVPNDCGVDAFRSHGRIEYNAEHCWGYSTQEGEPNPEVFHYQWPFVIPGAPLLWFYYTLYWHASC